MIITSSAKYAVGATAISVMLAGCSTGSQSAFSPSSGMLSTAYQSLVPTAKAAPSAFRPNGLPPPMLYVSSWGSGAIFGYKSPHDGHADKKNNAPTCTFDGGATRGVEDIAADAHGNLMVPSITFSSKAINIYAPNCGASIGTITDSYGAPYDAASANASTGNIVVASNALYAGSVSICTLAAGCTSNLPLPTVYSGQNGAFAVAVNRAGDCWAQAIYTTNSGTIYGLDYFKRCSGTGQIATGFLSQSKGGLDIDKGGNVVSLDSNLGGTRASSLLYVYKGCNPKCTVVGGPFALHSSVGEFYGHLDKAGNTLATMDFFTPEINVYRYTPTKVTYLYSITNGMSSCADCTGVAFAPSITK